MNKRALSVILTLTMSASLLQTPVLGNEYDVYSDTIIPTEEPLATDTGTEDIIKNDFDDLNYTSPEKTDKSLINESENVEYSDSDLSVDSENELFDNKYSMYSKIITGDEDAIDALNEFYSENISAENENIYDILGKYFEEEDISNIESLNKDNEDRNIYKLFACFWEDENTTDEEREAVATLILNGHTIIDSFNALFKCKRKILEGKTDENSSIKDEILLNADSNFYDYTGGSGIMNSSEAVGISALTDMNKPVYDAGIIAAKYYKPQSNNISIDNKSGNLRYTRRDVEIPLESGYMTLDLCYSVDDAKMAFYCYEEWEDGGTLRSNKSTAEYNENPLGAGWRFNLSRIENNILYLKDGRNIQLANGLDKNHYYKDIVVSRDSRGTVVTYLDGSQEIIDNADGLLYESIDKYGNITEYTYTKINNKYTPDSVSSQGKTITIEYNDDSTVIYKPNGGVVKYLKEDMDIEYGSLENRSWTKSAKVLSKVILCEGRNELCDAIFYYRKTEVNTFSGTYNGIYCLDYYVYAAISEIEGSDGNCYSYFYDSGTLNEDGSRKTYNAKVTQKIIYEYNSNDNFHYSDVAYNFSLGTVTETFENNKLVIMKTSGGTRTTETYETLDGTNILRQKEILKYHANCEHIPDSYENIVYNKNGNSIKTRHEYTYNDYDQLLTDKVYIEDKKDNETDYEYTNHFVTKTTYKKNDVIQKTIYTDRGSHGEVTREYVGQYNNAANIYTYYEYDGNYRLKVKKSKRAADTDYEYYEQYEYADICLPSAISNRDGNTVLSRTEYTYDTDSGRVLSVTDGNGNTTVYKYDARGNITTERCPDGAVTLITYNDDNSNGYTSYYTVQPVMVNLPNCHRYVYTYSYTGSVKNIEEIFEGDEDNQDNTVRAVKYDIYGNLISDTDANGGTVTYENDIFGRQISAKHEQDENAVHTYYYDVFFDGNEKCSAVITVDQTGKASIQYYNLYGQNYKNAVIKNMSSLSGVNWDNIVQLPSNAQLVITQTNEFDDLDRVIKTCDGESRPVTYEYDVLDNVTKQVTGKAGDTPLEVEYTYDSMGNVIETVQAGHITEHEYDKAGRLVKTTDPMGFTETYKYDKCGNIIEAVDKNGDKCTNLYNNMNQLIKTTKNGESKQYEYDDTYGNVISQTDSSGTISYEYNPDGTLASKTYPDGKTISYTEYDRNKNLLSMTDYFGNVTKYAYDGKNQITSIAERYANTTDTKTAKYQYNEDGSVSKATMPEYVTRYYTYDYAGRISTLRNETGRVQSYSRHSYTYDNAGNITQEREQRGSDDIVNKVYEYDSLNRLAYENIGNSYINSYTYDEYNNLISAIGAGDTYYTYDKNNRLISVIDLWCQGETETGKVMDDWYIDYTYDNNGNLLSSSKYSDNYTGNQRDYSYNAWGQLTSYSDTLGGSAEYTYYADGLRGSKKLGSDTIKYYYNGDTVINETKNGNKLATNVNGADGFISRYQGGQDNYFMFNAHGDTILTFAGWRTGEYHYDAWGAENNEYNYWSDANPIRYSGQYTDAESGMQYLRGRYYSSEIRRFITEDPAKDGLNWYAYCGNNPVMFVDPTGWITDEEKEMYENGEMSPGAYSYLMKLTYNYYLADTDEDRLYYSNLADNFRVVNYSSTPFESWNFIINGMDSKPTGELTKEEHFFRNELNIEFSYNDLMELNRRLPNDMKWTDDVASSLHQNNKVNGQDNVKYVSGCGHFEVIYNANHEIQNQYNNPADMGTYNYYSPVTNWYGHVMCDVIPYYQYGNVYNSERVIFVL